MKVSQNGVTLIKKYEGLRLQAYQCPGGVWTIGYGHTSGVSPIDMITEEEADKLLLLGLREAEKTINRYVTKRLEQHQFDALASFIFNVGIGNFRRSLLLKKINSGDLTGASKEFLRWIHAKGVKLKGLENRRQDEYALFVSGGF